MIMPIAWIDGQWGSSSELKLPLQDRALQLADGIFETILILNQKPQLLGSHLRRWEQSASLLGMASPPDQNQLDDLIGEAIVRSGIENNPAALRLNWSRGDSKQRGIDIDDGQPDKKQHRFWLEINPYPLIFSPLTTWVSRFEQRNAVSLLSRCKTFGYGQNIQARREAKQAGFDDAILRSTTGEVSCGSCANILVYRQKSWLTPRLASGCLPGIMRQRALDCGLVQEAVLNVIPEPGDEWLLINSLSCRPISLVNTSSLTLGQEVQGLWQSLLKPGP